MYACGRDKTSVTSNHILSRYIRLQLGINNAPSSFQGPIHAIISTFNRQFARLDLDGISMCSKSVSNHLLISNPSLAYCPVPLCCWGGVNASFLCSKFYLLIHVIVPGRPTSLDEATDAIGGLKQPSNVTDLEMFLLLGSVFHWLPRASTNLRPAQQKASGRTALSLWRSWQNGRSRDMISLSLVVILTGS